MKRTIIAISISATLLFVAYNVVTKTNINFDIEVATEVDSLNGVAVYFNGGVNHVLERNVSNDGYNIGLKYQCVEFIKRYYYEFLGHKMPDSYGHAKDFFDHKVKSGDENPQRALLQFKNGVGDIPQVNDIVVYKATILNPYGHVSIVSDVDSKEKKIEIIQQNPGPFSPSREIYEIEKLEGGWLIKNSNILGWLHKQ